jgi:hypothetical protein
VRLYSTGGTGTYGIVFSTDSTRPDTSNSTTLNPIILPPIITEDRTNENLSDSVLLNAGTWYLYVTAYMDEEKTKPVAHGGLRGIVIRAGGTTARSITLDPFADGIGEGTFSWNIGYPENVSEATMTITRLPLSPATEQVAQTISFTGVAPQTGSIALNTGYYHVVFVLQNDLGLTIVRRETLHIYQNMESSFEYTFTNSHFSAIDADNFEDFGPVAVISNIFNVATTAEWDSAISAISGGGNNKNYVINVLADFSVAGHTTNTFGNITGVKVSIRGEGQTLTLSSNGNMVRIASNQILILRDLTLYGHGSNNNSLVYVSGTNATFTMNGGKITGNTSSYSSNDGGGVYVASSGTFTMEGGEITGNTSSGGGVHVSGTNATFTMSGGEISGNTSSSYGGGGVRVSGTNATFTMSGGEISGNTSSSSSSYSNGGGGVYVGSGTFTMSGGEISGNTSSSSSSSTNGGAAGWVRVGIRA